MLTPSDLAFVREAIAPYGDAVADEALVGAVPLRIAWLRVLRRYPMADEPGLDADVVADLRLAQALVIGSRVVLGLPKSVNARLGDMSLTETFDPSAASADLIAQAWGLLDGWGVIGAPSVVRRSRVGGFFRLAHGERGRYTGN